MKTLKNKKIIYGILIMLLFSILISGCSSQSQPSNDMSFTESDQGIKEEMGYDDSMDEDMEYEVESTEPDKIITTVSITMQTKEFMDTTDKLNNLIQKHKGYIEQSNISYNNYINNTRLKYSNYSIRIPRANLELFISELKEIGNVISENKNKQDITKQYRDTESRLRVLETKEERILALLERAEKMEDIIALENQLSDIIYDKENLTANIMDMDDKVDYSTVHFQLEEVAKLTSGDSIRTSFIERIKNAFSDSMYFFANSFQSLIISLIYFLPYLLIILVIVFVVYKFINRRKKKLSKKSNNLDNSETKE